MPPEESPFVQEVVQGAGMAEDDTTLATQTGQDSETDLEVLRFKPKDLKRGAISEPK